MYNKRPYSRPDRVEFKKRKEFECNWEDFETDETRTVVDVQELGVAKRDLAKID